MKCSTVTKLKQERFAASWNGVWQMWRSCQFRTRFGSRDTYQTRHSSEKWLGKQKTSKWNFLHLRN